jgi:hypothetical protein
MKRDFCIGSEWLYYKLYTKLLKQRILFYLKNYICNFRIKRKKSNHKMVLIIDTKMSCIVRFTFAK